MAKHLLKYLAIRPCTFYVPYFETFNWLLYIDVLTVAKSSYLGKAVDIWAAGVTLYCMMYGKVSITGANNTAPPTFHCAGAVLPSCVTRSA